MLEQIHGLTSLADFIAEQGLTAAVAALDDDGD
jgi:hypothetical protein